MSWKSHFKQAVESYKHSKFDEALKLLNKAIEDGGQEQHVVFDSRAAVYTKLGDKVKALADAREVIQLAPKRWQGYSRAARLFLQSQRFEQAQKMVDAALNRLPAGDGQNRVALNSLVTEIRETRRQSACHIATLPYELILEVFHYLVDADSANVLLVSKISQRMRNVVLQSPSLWTTLVLTNRAPIRKCSSWIGRSKGRIRELIVRRTVLDEGKWTAANLKGIQWSELRVLRLEDLNLMQYFDKQDEADCTLSSLQELDFSDKLFDGKRDPFITKYAAHVQRLKLEGSFTGLFETFPSTLVHLTLRRVPARFTADLFGLLSLNPQLQELCLDTPFIDGGPDPTSPIPLHNLTSLECRCQGKIIPFLETPALTILRVGKSPNIDRSIQHLLDSATTLLTEISIDSCVVSEHLVIQLLLINPLLHHLTLNKLAAVSNPAVEALADTLTLCPALTHIDLADCPDVRTGPLRRLVASRLPKSDATTGEASEPSSLAPIHTIRVDGCPNIEPNFHVWFRERVHSFSCIYATKKETNWKR